jgi:hypothetical protein
MHILPRVFEPRQRPRDGFDVNCEDVAEKTMFLMVSPPVYSYRIMLLDESFDRTLQLSGICLRYAADAFPPTSSLDEVECILVLVRVQASHDSLCKCVFLLRQLPQVSK